MSRVRRILPRTAGARVITGVVAFLLALNLIGLVVSFLRPEPSGANGSAYATQPRGAAAYAELLRRAGHPVAYLRDPLAAARLDRATTLVVLDAPRLDGDERAALGRFVRAGGRLVAGGENAGRGVLARAPFWVPAGPRTARPPSRPQTSAAVPETRAVRSVTSAGEGGFSALGGTLPLLGDDPALLVIARAGRGRALLLADASPLQNRLLARADNAALALALAGPAERPVAFAESVHGHGRATGLAAIPARWRAALAFAVLAGLLWLASRARRLGPPELRGETPTPARREHVEALALGLRRARDAEVALAPVQAVARAQVIRRAALAPDAPDDAVRDAALRLGFEEDEAAAVSGARVMVQDGDVLSLGRALARGSFANVASETPGADHRHAASSDLERLPPVVDPASLPGGAGTAALRTNVHERPTGGRR